jgi:hypothetical protein
MPILSFEPILVMILALLRANIGLMLRNFFDFVTEVHWHRWTLALGLLQVKGSAHLEWRERWIHRCADRWRGRRYLLVVAQNLSEDSLRWVSLPLEPSEAQDLLRLKAKRCSDSVHKFKTADRRDEVRLRARVRGFTLGPEDNLAQGLASKNNMTGGASLPH